MGHDVFGEDVTNISSGDTAGGDLAGSYPNPTVATIGGGKTPLTADHNLSDVASASAARTNLGLGTAATHPATDFDSAGTAATETTRAETAEALLAPKASPTFTGLATGKGLALAVKLVNTTYLVTTSDFAIIADTSGAGFTVTLPDATAHPGQVYFFKNANVNTLTIATSLSQTIDGQATHTIVNAFCGLNSDGTNWAILIA